MPATYSSAPEVAAIARSIIEEHHTHLLSHDVRVEFLFVEPTPKSKGKEVWGKAQKVTSLAAFLASPEPDDTDEANKPFFAITIARAIWIWLKPAQRAALIDHELCHCWAEPDENGDVALSILAHDLEEFNAVVQRHGIWRGDVGRFAEVARDAQLRMPLEASGHGA